MTDQRVRFYSLAAIGIVAFIVWVSLFPFEFSWLPWATARDLFSSTRALLLDVPAWSITDIVSNAALFVPFGLFVSAAIETRRSRHNVAWVVAGSLMLSASLEFAQVFLIWRASSLLDVAAASVGALSGVGLRRRFRRQVDAFASRGEEIWDGSSGLERSLLLYSGIFACGWLLPFDVTIRPDEIRDKYHHQRLLLPLSKSPDAASSSHLAFALVAAIPVGMASRVCTNRQGAQRTLGDAIILAAASLLVLQTIQVLVFSRTTDMTEWLVAVTGAAAGAYLARRVDRRR